MLKKYQHHTFLLSHLIILIQVNINEAQDESRMNMKLENLDLVVSALAEKLGAMEINLEEIKGDNAQVSATIDALAQKNTVQADLIENVNAWKIGVQDNLIENVSNLAEKVGVQESVIENVKALEEKIVTLEEEMGDILKENVFLKTKGARTCAELKAKGFNESGVYDIDPAFTGTPMKVYCHMDTGVTEVLHDIDDTVDIGYCMGVGCFQQEYNYEASMTQIEALMATSSDCEQEIQFDCNIAPLKNTMFGLYYGWWVDRHGEKKYYFDGNNEDLHVCGCYPDCQSSMFNNTCNCDSSLVPFWNKDQGKITNKESLPIKSFVYGGFLHAQQQAKITVGSLRCNGTVESSFSGAVDLTSTCSSLKKGGNSVSGFYLTKPTQEAQLQVSYCRMSEPGYDNNDIKLGASIDFNKKANMVELEVASYVFQNGARYSSSWKNLIDLEISSPTIEEEMKGVGIELDLKAGRITFMENGVYVFINQKRTSTNTAWQVGSGYKFNNVYYIEKGQKITLTGHGNVKNFVLGIIPLFQISY